MIDLKACPECGVPEYVTSEFLWLDNGDIVQLRSQGNRMAFFESDNLSPLFSNVEKISGVPGKLLEYIAMNMACITAQQHVSLLVPKEVRGLIKTRELEPTPIAMAMSDVATMHGYGRQEMVDFRLENDGGDYYIGKIFEPYSVPLYCGTIAGTVEALVEYDFGASYEELSPDLYRVNVSPSSHPEKMKEIVYSQRYQHHDGDTKLERCATCGGPWALCGYRWHADRGVILNETNRRRMILMGPRQLDSIFRGLEAELGDSIPRTVVEAQRLFTVGGYYSIRDAQSAEDFRNQLALRGLGNLRELDISRRGMRMRLDNAGLHLIIVGMMQGVFDAALDVESRVEWEYSEERRLDMEVTPVSTKVAVRGRQV